MLAGLMLIGFAIWCWVRSKNPTVKALAALSLLAGAGLHIVGIQNLKIDKFLVVEKPEIKATIRAEVKKAVAENPPARPLSIRAALVDHLTIARSAPAIPVQVPQAPAPALGARWLGAVEDFGIGKYAVAELPQASQTELSRICSKTSEAAADKGGLLLIVGGTDRLPLMGNTRLRYDANTGLGLARAEAVKQALIAQGCWPRSEKGENTLTLTSGPRTTPEHVDQNDTKGAPGDRRVDVYVLAAQAEKTAPHEDVIVPEATPTTPKIKARSND